MDCPKIKITYKYATYEVVDCNFDEYRNEFRYYLDQTVGILNPFNSFSTSKPIPEGEFSFVKGTPSGSWIKGIHRDGLYIVIDSQKVDPAYSRLAEKLRAENSKLSEELRIANAKIRELEADIELLKSTKEFIEECKSASFS